jgi:Cu(I)/Ag(I) efflux system membrane fusion protein
MTVALTGAARAGSIATLLDPYFRIQDALVDDRIDTVKADAALVEQHATALGTDAKAIAAAAAELARAGNISAARLAFGKLSDAVIAYSEQTKSNPGDDVVAMYCPMVKKSWMQKGEKVRNPYYGKAMPNCGEKKKLG